MRMNPVNARTHASHTHTEAACSSTLAFVCSMCRSCVYVAVYADVRAHVYTDAVGGGKEGRLSHAMQAIVSHTHTQTHTHDTLTHTLATQHGG